jgi:hypothetical protein
MWVRTDRQVPQGPQAQQVQQDRLGPQVQLEFKDLQERQVLQDRLDPLVPLEFKDQQERLFCMVW